MYQGPRMSQHRARPGKRRAHVGPLLLGTEFSRGGEMQGRKVLPDQGIAGQDPVYGSFKIAL